MITMTIMLVTFRSADRVFRGSLLRGAAGDAGRGLRRAIRHRQVAQEAQADQQAQEATQTGGVQGRSLASLRKALRPVFSSWGKR